MLRWIALFALVAMVAFVGCGPKDGGGEQPDASGGDAVEETTESAVEEGSAAAEEAVEEAAEAVEEAAEAAEDELGDLADEFADFEVQGGSSASAQR